MILDALAVYRLWRLAAEDTILDRPRAALISWAWDRAHEDRAAVPGEDPDPKIIELLQCPWCLGLWLSLAAAAASSRAPRAWRAVRYPLAVSAAVGFLAEGLQKLER